MRTSSYAAMVEELWREIGDPAYGIGIKGAQGWIEERFGVVVSPRVIGYHLKKLRERKLNAMGEIKDLQRRVMQLEEGSDGGEYGNTPERKTLGRGFA